METKMIGNKISEARKKINISQAQLAERLFISPQAVGKWERGESMPDIIMLNRLAEILGVDLNYFSENMQSAATETILASSGDEPSSEQPSEKQKKKLSWDMSLGNWLDADFSGLKNLHEKFSAANMQRCLFIGSDLSGILLKGNHVESCDFSNSSFGSSQIQGSHIVNNQFKDCSLKETVFSVSHIKGCDFTGADFSGVTIKSSDFSKNIVVNAVWNSTSFNGSQITNIIFEGKVEDCSFENCSFSMVTFQNSILKNTFFKNKSLKRLRFIDCQADRLTYAFLKNGKADMSGIALLNH